MAYKIIELPDVKLEPGTTSWTKAYFQSLQIFGRQDEPIELIVTLGNYNETLDEKRPHYFKLRFTGVLEYRFIENDHSYEDLEQHLGDYKSGLIEVLNSAYIENMASKGMLGNYPVGQRFGKYDDDPNSGGIFEKDVRHFRLAFDEWGKLDVIALRLSIEQAHSG